LGSDVIIVIATLAPQNAPGKERIGCSNPARCLREPAGALRRLMLRSSSEAMGEGGSWMLLDWVRLLNVLSILDDLDSRELTPINPIRQRSVVGVSTTTWGTVNIVGLLTVGGERTIRGGGGAVARGLGAARIGIFNLPTTRCSGAETGVGGGTWIMSTCSSKASCARAARWKFKRAEICSNDGSGCFGFPRDKREGLVLGERSLKSTCSTQGFLSFELSSCKDS